MGKNIKVNAEIDEALLAKVLEETGAEDLTQAVERMFRSASENEEELGKLLNNVKTTNTLSITWSKDGVIGITSLRPVVGEDSKMLAKILNNLVGTLLADPKELEMMKQALQKSE